MRGEIRDMLLSISDWGMQRGTAAARTEAIHPKSFVLERTRYSGVCPRDDIGKHSQFLDGFARCGASISVAYSVLVAFRLFEAIQMEA